MRTRIGKKVGRKQVPLLQTNNAAILRNLLSKMGLLLLVFSISFLNNNSILSSSFGLPASSSNVSFLTNEQIHSEVIVDLYTDSIGIGSFTKHSIISFNFTVLPQSNSSVDFLFYYYYLNYTVWSPNPGNFTLGIGESFAGNFTLITALSSNTALFAFYTYVSSGGTNATVHYWYEVLVTGKTPAAGFLVLSGALVLLSLGVIFRSKRKVVEKNKHV